ncbi:MAG: aldo/keto reductase [Verrucomicrobiota bacterium]
MGETVNKRNSTDSGIDSPSARVDVSAANGLTRRDFVRSAIATGLIAGVGQTSWGAETQQGEMIYRQFGRTNEKVSAIGLGGFHIGNPKEEAESIRIIRRAIDGGITFMDNCWDYHNGDSETRMGKALRDGYRDKAFLMTKIDGRTKAAAAQQIDESLGRLQTDRIDLLQIHEVIRIEDPDRIFAEGGAMEAVQEAKRAGKIRHIGFTGHKDPIIHLRTLQIAESHAFRFDAVQMPLNLMDAHFRSFQRQVVPELVKNGIAVLGMKPLASGRILESKTASAIECLHYALSLPTTTVITGVDSMKILDQAFEAVRTFKPLGPEAVSALLARTAGAAAAGKFELFKTSNIFDATAQNPKWLG